MQQLIGKYGIFQLSSGRKSRNSIMDRLKRSKQGMRKEKWFQTALMLTAEEEI